MLLYICANAQHSHLMVFAPTASTHFLDGSLVKFEKIAKYIKKP
jgi:hypothetical protein